MLRPEANPSNWTQSSSLWHSLQHLRYVLVFTTLKSLQLPFSADHEVLTMFSRIPYLPRNAHSTIHAVQPLAFFKEHGKAMPILSIVAREYFGKSITTVVLEVRVPRCIACQCCIE